MVTLPIANGDVWNIQASGVYDASILALPVGASGLTISGNGNTLTMSNAGVSGGFTFNSADAVMSLSDVTVDIGTQYFAKDTSAGTNFGLTLGLGAGTVFDGGNNGGGVAYAGTVTVNGDATAKSITTSSSAFYASSGSVTVNGSLTANDITGTSGATIRSGGATTLITGAVTIDKSTTTVAEGGAISAAALEIDGATSITNSTAATQGGAIFVNSVTSTGTPVLFKNDVTLTGNTAGKTGGALEVTAGNTVINGNANISNNKANGSAGDTSISMYYGGAGVYFELGGSLTIDGNAVFNSNVATTAAAAASTNAIMGGAVSINNRVAGMSYNLAIGGTAAFDGNSVSTSGSGRNAGGGAVWAPGGVTIAKAASFTNNSATTTAGGSTGALGGAIYANSANFANDATNGNVLLRGGATITGNSASTTGTGVAGGGAIYAGNVVTIGTSSAAVTATINNNTAQSAGGAVSGGAIRSGGNFTVYGGATINGNSATANGGLVNGGAIYSNGGNIQITQTATASGNTATAGGTGSANGGALGAYGGVRIGGTATLNNNTATSTGSGGGYGGAIFANAGGSPSTSALAVVFDADATLNTNTAKSYGGAIYSNAVVQFSGAASLDGNKATNNNGGAIDAPVATVAGIASFTNNKAGGNGGGFYGVSFAANGGGTFSGNLAASGGAIYAGQDVTINSAANGSDTLFSNNTASNGFGGAIYLNSSAVANMNIAVSSGSLKLNATTGNIVFSGNQQSPGIVPAGCGMVASCANAIYFNNVNATTATFNAAAGHSIIFYDPISSGTGAGMMTVLKTGDGLLSFDGSHYSAVSDQQSTIAANTTVQGGTFEIANNAAYGIWGVNGGMTSFTTNSGTMLQGGQYGSLISGSVTLNGDLSIAGRSPYTSGYSTFAISAPSLTFGGGRILFNTYLNDGSVQNSDKLVLEVVGASPVSGNAFVYVTNTGGPGGSTYNNKGILLIEMEDGTTLDSTFRLGAPVIAGAYQYDLTHNADGNWYLTNMTAPPNPPGPNPDPVNPPAPPSPAVPRIQPGVPTHAAVMPLASEYGYALLDTLHERVGDTFVMPLAPVYEQRTVRCKNGRGNCTVRTMMPQDNAETQKWASSGWARLIGTRGLHQPDNFMRRGPNYDYTFGAIQAGLDIYGRESRDGALDKAGLYAAYGQITSNVKGQFGGKAGSVDMDAYTLGGYWTHKASQGWYTDAVVQATWYSATATTILGQKTSPDGFGILGSLEGGYAFKLGDGFAIEPQAQIVYQNVSFGNVSDGYLVGYQFSGGDSLRGRLGVRLSKTLIISEAAQPRLLTGWLRANIWHEFLGKSQVAVGDIRDWNAGTFVMPSYLGGTWGEIGAGVTAQMTDKINVFATGAYQHSLDNRGRQSWDGRLGMTVKW